MRLCPILLVSLLAIALSGCGPSISSINARPEKYYQHKVTFRGRIARMQFLPHDTLLEVADDQGRRILVRSADPVDATTGDWVRVEGILVPEARVADVVLYDVVTADRVSVTRAPRLLGLM